LHQQLSGTLVLTSRGVRVSIYNDDVVLQQVALDRVWQTVDPFLFCVHHDDDYPEGDDELGPCATRGSRWRHARTAEDRVAPTCASKRRVRVRCERAQEGCIRSVE
jgi:hypothetical protein